MNKMTSKFKQGDLVFVTERYIKLHYAVDHLDGAGGIVLDVHHDRAISSYYYIVLFFDKSRVLDEKFLRVVETGNETL